MLHNETDSYRRGLTLGLTMAEIFILLLFLFLLVLFLLHADGENLRDEKKDLQNINHQNENYLVELKKTIEESSQLPDEITRLVRREKRTKHELYNEIKKRAAIGQDLAKSQQENKRLREILKGNRKQTKRELYSTKKDLAESQRENEQLRAELAESQKNELAGIYSNKGIDPHCFYKVKIDKNGNRKENSYSLLDIAVHDRGIRVKLRQVPQDRAIDEKGKSASKTYPEEHRTLPLDSIRENLSEYLSNDEFIKITKPIKQMGKNKQIRPYSCVFTARLSDCTSEKAGAKKFWQDAETAIKESFYIDPVRKRPWCTL